MDLGLQTNHIRTMAQQPGMEWIWNMALLICIIILYYIVILLFYVLKYKNVSGALERDIGAHVILSYIRVVPYTLIGSISYQYRTYSFKYLKICISRVY